MLKAKLAPLLVLAAIPWLGATAQQQTPATESGDSRPRIALALSGGGARGGAHIGVLMALRDLGVPVDYVAGTSMGAVIGGLYASGLDEDELQETAGKIDWAEVLSDSTSRDDKSFHRKRDDDLYLIKTRAGFNDGAVELPMGLRQGQHIDLFLSKTFLPVSHIESFDDLPIPFRAVAADIVTGDAVVLTGGSLARALRASLSIPAAFAPVEIDGRLLVDGGIAQNLPIDTARAMGADVVIAVDISTPLAGRDEMTSVVGIASQLTGFLTNRGTAEQLTRLAPGDVLIRPDLEDVKSGDFERMEDTYAMGYAATMAVADQLRAIALSPEAYRAHRASRPSPRRETTPEIDFVRLKNDSRVANNIIEARLEDIPINAPLDFDATESAIARVYGLDLFQNVRYGVVEEAGSNGLEIEVQERSWGPNYLQGGLEYSQAGDDDNLFGVSLSYLRTAMNSLGAEWRSTITLGDEPGASTEWHQPVGWNALGFGAASLRVEMPLVNVYDGETRVAQVQARQALVDVSTGREFGNWGELRFGMTGGNSDMELRTGNPGFVLPEDLRRGELFGRFTYDTLDSLYFPSGGALVRAEWRNSYEDLGADQEFEQVDFRATGARRIGKNVLTASMRYSSTVDGVAPLQNLFRIGGLFQLGGFAQNELTGQNAGRLLLGYSRRLGQIRLLPAYAGFTYEKGNVWADRRDVSINSALDSRSIWVGADTPIGPMYLAYGSASGGRESVYLFIGSVF